MRFRHIALPALLLGALLFSHRAAAQVLEALELERLPDASLIRARFSEPVLYVRHFPEQRGETLLINVRALKIGESARAGASTRKSLRGTPNNELPLRDVTFETEEGPDGTRLVLRFTREVRYSVRQGRDGRSIEIEVQKPLPPRPEEAPGIAPGPEAVYAVNLRSSPTHIPGLQAVRAQLGDLPGTVVYQAQVRVADQEAYVLRLGFFASAAEAEAARQKLLDRFPLATVTPVNAAERGAAPPPGAVEAKPAPAPTVPVPATPVPAAPAVPLTLPTGEAMEAGRAALARGDNVAAINLFTQLLERPVGAHTQEASELLGLARERNKQPELAEVEYRLYLKLYPTGEGAGRVRQRLANLLPPDAVELKAARRAEDDEARTDIFGSLSQYYYRGNSRIDTTDKTGPTVGEPDTLSLVDQSAIVNYLDFNARYRSRRYDNRAVLSADYTYDFLSDADTTRWRSIYGEIKDRDLNYLARLGRQPGLYGVLTRFDGGLFSQRFTPSFGLNVVAGEPYDTVAPGSDRKFFGVSTDLNAGGGFSGNLYYFDQTIDGITDRRAVGSELRYFRENMAIFGLIDYELAFDELNIFLLNGNWQWPGGTSINAAIDLRRSPSLQTSNALLGETVTSIRELLATRTEDQIRQDALDRTPKTKVYSVSVLHPLGADVQVGGDIVVTNIGPTPASGSLPASPGTGNVITYAPKLIASNLLFDKDVSVVTAGVSRSDAFDAVSVSVINRTPFRKWRLDTALRYYRQDNADGSVLKRLTPSIKLDYRWKPGIAFEIELGQERTSSTGISTDEESTRDYVTLGYRWDF